MAQAVKNKDVRKNCVDVEKVIIQCLSDFENKDTIKISEPINSKKLNKELLNFRSEYNTKFAQELSNINQVKQTLVYKNYAIY